MVPAARRRWIGAVLVLDIAALLVAGIGLCARPSAVLSAATARHGNATAGPPHTVGGDLDERWGVGAAEWGGGRPRGGSTGGQRPVEREARPAPEGRDTKSPNQQQV